MSYEWVSTPARVTVNGMRRHVWYKYSVQIFGTNILTCLPVSRRLRSMACGGGGYTYEEEDTCQ